MERFFKNKPLILVVDDMEENTAILETMIKSIGCRSILGRKRKRGHGIDGEGTAGYHSFGYLNARYRWLSIL